MGSDIGMNSQIHWALAAYGMGFSLPEPLHDMRVHVGTYIRVSAHVETQGLCRVFF